MEGVPSPRGALGALGGRRVEGGPSRGAHTGCRAPLFGLAPFPPPPGAPRLGACPLRLRLTPLVRFLLQRRASRAPFPIAWGWGLPLPLAKICDEETKKKCLNVLGDGHILFLAFASATWGGGRPARKPCPPPVLFPRNWEVVARKVESKFEGGGGGGAGLVSALSTPLWLKLHFPQHLGPNWSQGLGA